jgi:dTDP-4-dehydrorhamnose 3,5-epimerase-like enzyme
MIPIITVGGNHSDLRGTLFYNNDFDLSLIKRMYVIENLSTDFVRAWQGHQIEQRWFSVIKGSFRIQLIAIDYWDTPPTNLERFTFLIDSEKLDVLKVPSGYVSSIQSLEQGSKLLVFSDYFLGEIKDEYRYEVNYFD